MTDDLVERLRQLARSKAKIFPEDRYALESAADALASERTKVQRLEADAARLEEEVRQLTHNRTAYLSLP